MTVRHNRAQERQASLADQFVGIADRALRSMTGTTTTGRTNPAAQQDDGPLQPDHRRHAARLMRVNHSGEVAAQALYHGQAMTARLEQVRETMERSAAEESDHLAWCEQRISELGGRRSLLNPLWYAGSFTIGALAGIAGDRWSLGFVAETERQVVQHLDGHLDSLPESDSRSRAILEQMREDEAEHGETASQAGGVELPQPIPLLMTAVSKVMTRAAYWI
jgi:ubiquinone biosynthesis monooxygenase Coq7